MKRMKHPLHGFHHAYDTNEEATMRLNGWVEDVPDVEVPEQKITSQDDEKRKPGRPKKSDQDE